MKPGSWLGWVGCKDNRGNGHYIRKPDSHNFLHDFSENRVNSAFLEVPERLE